MIIIDNRTTCKSAEIGTFRFRTSTVVCTDTFSTLYSQPFKYVDLYFWMFSQREMDRGRLQREELTLVLFLNYLFHGQCAAFVVQQCKLSRLNINLGLNFDLNRDRIGF